MLLALLQMIYALKGFFILLQNHLLFYANIVKLHVCTFDSGDQ